MNKSDKKLEKALRESLTEVCDIALESVAGFQWITHRVDFKRFPDSLRIVAVFATDDDISHAKSHREDLYLQSLITDKLTSAGIKLKKPEKQIFLDSEQACDLQCEGDWNRKLLRY
ncbi:hypothetical protein [Neptuniibacter caesariensis]|uniref:Fis family transcriptional regulator n=1 Tax=Neptuniibacter caesariensis TaxID=207954 RepID=A0A7U8GT74_NEPCE|nr:hypothetical protein [Neptuniibacter caesariensis]EAR61987.1 hypothetical protein MED92_03528 [Oceanospirillum sp. MED92] [Neptuniibacter caesariensis]